MMEESAGRTGGQAADKTEQKEVYEGKYGDIIHLPHHVSVRHAQMPMHERAAQFAPFAALTGHEEAVRETARLTEQKVELSEDEKEILNRKLQEIDLLHTEAAITHFVQDARKAGGKYVTDRGRVKKIDRNAGFLVMEDETEIEVENIVKLEY